MRGRSSSILLTVALLLFFGREIAGADQPTLQIRRVAEPPKLEDFLDGAPADRGVEVDGFVQREPDDGKPVTQATKAYVSYDDRNLYVVFVCKDAEPGKIRARMAAREQIFNDDIVAVGFDTFLDRQRSYVFMVNALGIQADAIRTEGRGTDWSFDTLWHSRGQLTADGFVVWMAIPFKSLRFSSADVQTWGIGFQRDIPRNNESAFWPNISRKVEGIVQQFATLNGLERVSPGRNVQIIPYGVFAGVRLFDQATADRDVTGDARIGIDAKVVLRDRMTLDLAANPDFSQVESDEPQVTINQRFEVFFPEKRPFFIENRAFFQTPESLFFSRRIADPQVGARLTGKVGRWAIGGLVMNDRAPGRRVSASDPAFGSRAAAGVVRVQREFGQQSSVGALVTSRDFGSTSNRVASVDARLKLNPNWVFTGQAIASTTTLADGTHLGGPAFLASLNRSGRNFTYSLNYNDRDPEFRSSLGFIPRVDIRQAQQFISYRWRPTKRRLLAFGPNLFTLVNWTRAGALQDWEVRTPMEFSWTGQTGLFVRRIEKSELFAGRYFRQYINDVSFGTAWLKWLEFFVFAAESTRPNFFPAGGVPPYLAHAVDGFAEIVVRPAPHIRVSQTYIYSRRRGRDGDRPAGVSGTPVIFDNHLLRSRLNYQFTRELSLRLIVDYNAVLPNSSLIGLDREKQFSSDILLTYLVNPGTALYVGYTDRYENLALDPGRSVERLGAPSTSTARQFFVKTSYLWRF
jgi:hypothetical protein